MAELDRQYITLYFSLGESRTSQSDDEELMQRLLATHAKAYSLVDESWKRIPGRLTFEGEIEIENFELCADDCEVEDRQGFLSFGIGFTSHMNLPASVVRGMRDCVEWAFSKAAASDGLSVRFLGGTRLNRVTVLRRGDIDFDGETPEVV